MSHDRPRAAFAIFLTVAFFCGAGLAAVIADAATGDARNFGYVLILMIGMAMFCAKRFVDWASGS